MRTTTDATSLRDALAVLKRYAGRGNERLPATGLVTLTAGTGTLIVRRWTIEADATATMHGSTDEAGSVYVKVDALTVAIGKAKGPLTLTTDDGTLTVTAGTVTATVPLRDGADVPTDDRHVYTRLADVGIDEAPRLRSVAVAAARGNDARAVLSGIYFDAVEGCAVATDTYRMHGAELRVISATAIVPADHVIAATVTATGPINLGINGDGKRYSIDYFVGKGTKNAPRVTVYRVSGFTVDGPFPNYAALLPSPDDAAAVWSVADAAGTATATVPFHNKDNTPMHVAAFAGAVRLTSRDRDGATLDGTAPIVTAADDAPTFAVNARYFGDAASMAGDGSALRVRDGMRAVHFDGDRTFALLMPMRIS